MAELQKKNRKKYTCSLCLLVYNNAIRRILRSRVDNIQCIYIEPILTGNLINKMNTRINHIIGLVEDNRKRTQMPNRYMLRLVLPQDARPSAGVPMCSAICKPIEEV